MFYDSAFATDRAARLNPRRWGKEGDAVYVDALYKSRAYKRQIDVFDDKDDIFVRVKPPSPNDIPVDNADGTLVVQGNNAVNNTGPPSLVDICANVLALLFVADMLDLEGLEYLPYGKYIVKAVLEKYDRPPRRVLQPAVIKSLVQAYPYEPTISRVRRLSLQGFDIIQRPEFELLLSIGEVLTFLDLRDVCLSDNELRFINQLTQLRVLDISANGITNAGIGILARPLSKGTMNGLVNLTHLNLSSLPITQDCIPTLFKFPELEVLDLSMTKIKHDHVPEFQKRGWTLLPRDLRIFNIRQGLPGSTENTTGAENQNANNNNINNSSFNSTKRRKDITPYMQDVVSRATYMFDEEEGETDPDREIPKNSHHFLFNYFLHHAVHSVKIDSRESRLQGYWRPPGYQADAKERKDDPFDPAGYAMRVGKLFSRAQKTSIKQFGNWTLRLFREQFISPQKPKANGPTVFQPVLQPPSNLDALPDIGKLVMPKRAIFRQTPSTSVAPPPVPVPVPLPQSQTQTSRYDEDSAFFSQTTLFYSESQSTQSPQPSLSQNTVAFGTGTTSTSNSNNNDDDFWASLESDTKAKPFQNRSVSQPSRGIIAENRDENLDRQKKKKKKKKKRDASPESSFLDLIGKSRRVM